MTEPLNPLYAAFLSQPPDFREYLHAPFRDGEHTIYCDGYSMIATQCKCKTPSQIKDTQERLITPAIDALKSELFTIQPIEYTAPVCKICNNTRKVTTCPECEGSGEVSFENDHNTYYCDCKTCDGAPGQYTCDHCPRPTSTPVDVRGTKIDAKFIARAQALPSPIFSLRGGFLAFKFNGGFGLIMKMDDSVIAHQTAITHPHKEA
jgi:hypothetical protein